MFYTNRHFYVCESFARPEWLVCEVGSFWSVSVSSKYRAQFIRGYLLKWLCGHEYYRLMAFFRFVELLKKDLSDWNLVRKKILFIDSASGMAF